MKGMWDEILVLVTVPFTEKSNYKYIKLALTHRQYFTLVKEKLSFAYRISYQPKIAGNMPFYMLPFVYSTNITRDGLGGAKNLRGVLRNRIVGEDIAYANAELRWKFYQTVLFNQNIYFAIAPFCDAGIVTRKHSFSTNLIPPEINIKNKSEQLHLSYGSGLYIAMNQNFVISINYGLANDRNDGTSGLYIGLNFLY